MGALGLACAGTAVAQQKPNIVIIVADDLGWGDVGYHGSVIATPNIDRLARKGIELDRFYVSPVSSPTRAGLLTGRYPNRFGIRETVIPPWRDYGLDENEQTMADVLGENGYPNRALIGKWHLGHSRLAYCPLNRGFTHFYGHLNGAIDYFTHERDGELDWHRGWDSSYDKGYSTDLITDEAVSCISQYAGSDPYLIYVAYNAPHSPYQAPDDEITGHIDLVEFYSLEKKDRNAYIYRAMVTRMDKGIGRIVEAVESSGQAENTLVLFMSDNGGVPNLPGGSTNEPFRGSKFTEWDGGVRVPAILYWPAGFAQGGRKLEQVTGFVDILPTLADIAGIDSPPTHPYDGISIYPVLRGDEENIYREMYLGCGAVVNRDWKFILPGHNNRMKLDREFLVRYSHDPYETANNINGNKEIADYLRSIAVKYDTISPSVKEIPYAQGRDGFIPPKEWKVTVP